MRTEQGFDSRYEVVAVLYIDNGEKKSIVYFTIQIKEIDPYNVLLSITHIIKSKKKHKNFQLLGILAFTEQNIYQFFPTHSYEERISLEPFEPEAFPYTIQGELERLLEGYVKTPADLLRNFIKERKENLKKGRVGEGVVISQADPTLNTYEVNNKNQANPFTVEGHWLECDESVLIILEKVKPSSDDDELDALVKFMGHSKNNTIKLIKRGK